ncbi:MAG: hypothetical protein ACYTE2_00915 [Planctomycetota bacterium]|jgi:hypothetical protein|nr:hypothetical protein [Planctomycetota bacterium]
MKRRRRLVGGLLLATVSIGSGTAGCQKVLFPAKSTRSQFEDYDRMRQVYVPMQVPDMYGKPRPALRERLTTE